MAAKGALPPLIGRRAELLRMTQVLLLSRKDNLILVGEPGVGKTGVVEGFAQLLVEGRLPEALGRPAAIEVSLTSLVAGTKFRGEFEERLEAVIREVSQEPRPILFIAEMGREDSGGETPHERPGERRPSRIRVELDQSAEELILREGFSDEYGARNLERAVCRMLGTLIAEALLSGHLNPTQMIRVVDGRLKLKGSAGEDADH